MFMFTVWTQRIIIDRNKITTYNNAYLIWERLGIMHPCLFINFYTRIIEFNDKDYLMLYFGRHQN